MQQYNNSVDNIFVRTFGSVLSKWNYSSVIPQWHKDKDKTVELKAVVVSAETQYKSVVLSPLPACTSSCHNTITALWRLKRRRRSVEVLEEKIAAAHSGWSEIAFCLTQDGFHSEISETDQYRIKMEKGAERRVDSFGLKRKKDFMLRNVYLCCVTTYYYLHVETNKITEVVTVFLNSRLHRKQQCFCTFKYNVLLSIHSIMK